MVLYHPPIHPSPREALATDAATDISSCVMTFTNEKIKMILSFTWQGNSILNVSATLRSWESDKSPIEGTTPQRGYCSVELFFWLLSLVIIESGGQDFFTKKATRIKGPCFEHVDLAKRKSGDALWWVRVVA